MEKKLSFCFSVLQFFSLNALTDCKVSTVDPEGLLGPDPEEPQGRSQVILVVPGTARIYCIWIHLT